MPEYKWPEAEDRRFIGKRISRLDGPAKVSGAAKYTYDVNLNGMLYGKILRSPYAHSRIVSIDISQAESLPGVKVVRVIQGPGTEIQWAGDEIVGVAAVSEEIAEDALRRIQVKYEKLPHLVKEEDLSKAGDRLKPAAEQQKGEPEQALQESEVISEGYYGQAVITHCCLEPHGQVVRWDDDENITVWASTQNVSGLGGQFAEPLEIPAGNVRTITPHMGGGFGSKFGADRWGIESARLAKQAKQPVKMLLDRDAELMVAGARPSLYGRVKVGAKQDGTLTGWESESWGTGGIGGAGVPPLPYVFDIPNQKKKHTFVTTNIGGARAWRAPNHPQACVVTMGALADLAAKLNMDPLDLFLKNVGLTGAREETYRQELQKASELMDWKKRWHPSGKGGSGIHRQGLGLALHTWGGRGHNSNCNLSIHPDGSVEVSLGSQDLGVGTRTVIAMTAAETIGIPLEGVRVNLGDSRFPPSGASGGSTTVGGVTSATRRAALDAQEQLLMRTAPALGATPDQLEISQSKRIQVKGDPSRSFSWKEACGRLGVRSLTATGKNPGPGKLNSSGVGGVQMADVVVDIETGVVKMNKFVAVQDCGLVINIKTAESQVYGSVIMGVCYSLYEEKIMDEITGRMLNPNMEFYKLAGIGDIGEIVVHMMTGPGYDDRGVIGLGEPPVISPGAAIANAVANALGVRVSTLPLTPDKVLAAIEKGEIA